MNITATVGKNRLLIEPWYLSVTTAEGSLFRIYHNDGGVFHYLPSVASRKTKNLRWTKIKVGRIVIEFDYETTPERDVSF